MAIPTRKPSKLLSMANPSLSGPTPMVHDQNVDTGSTAAPLIAAACNASLISTTCLAWAPYQE
jgi:hypothetical protein